MKKTFLFLALALPMFVAAQIMEVTSMTKVDVPSKDVKVAGVSADGSYLLLTGMANQGLQKLDLSTGKVSVLSEAEGAGYNAQIAPDGKSVVYREVVIGKDKLRRTKLMQQVLDTRKVDVLVKETRNLDGYAIQGNTVVSINKRKASAKVAAPVVSIENRQLMITRGSKSVILSPNGVDKSYLWPSVSPDGSKICYYVAGNGCWVCNIDGSNKQFIGRDCRAAKWYDNNTIVAMADEDDGHVTTASSIVAYTLDGKSQVLAPSTMLAVYPQVAQGKIVFSTEFGEVYVMNVK